MDKTAHLRSADHPETIGCPSHGGGKRAEKQGSNHSGGDDYQSFHSYHDNDKRDDDKSNDDEQIARNWGLYGR